MNPSQHNRAHAALWEGRLQDGLDDCLDTTGRTDLQAHLTTCPRCRRRADELHRIDRALTDWLGRPQLDASFDDRLWKAIGA